jgi:hypothetical protein
MSLYRGDRTVVVGLFALCIHTYTHTHIHKTKEIFGLSIGCVYALGPVIIQPGLLCDAIVWIEIVSLSRTLFRRPLA